MDLRDYNIPEDCRPLVRYRFVNTKSLLTQTILSMTWFNWPLVTVNQIKIELNNLETIQYAPAKTGYWFRYFVPIGHQKLLVEFYIRVVPQDH